MFHELKNEAKITILLHTKSPLSIRSAEGKLLAPDLPDMQCVKSRYQDKYTVIIPGSSLKGVVRQWLAYLMNHTVDPAEYAAGQTAAPDPAADITQEEGETNP